MADRSWTQAEQVCGCHRAMTPGGALVNGQDRFALHSSMEGSGAPAATHRRHWLGVIFFIPDGYNSR